ncbi:fimbrial protein [Porphyromonas levii]|uniref:fimbrial protein n=1 Tax=Porphyromonas levii TaxID=28114 RepID=UPI001B8B6EA8|nr:fimbrial protein [Porphyromonas levii]MBR8713567.1 hypothetical protein [Porphyromonas levii]MBR8715614.1 hypothetical protein [Porphyromonas levii]MBR8728126.1 hypothetical protein [Porphyromonas levii]MBR8736515.1 hypothetical protein [Porphyromonas levii]MBR8778492.1 hypothetical protein [Porphyromonas levii]
MNKQKFLKTLVVFLCTLGFSSCVYDNELENGCGTYMSAVLSEGYVPLRAQEDHSINVDAKDFEDRVNTLAMLVFSTGSDDRSAYHYAAASTVTANIPATRVNPGNNDIYFFANVPEDEVKDLTTREKVEAYMKETKVFNSTLNKGATAALGFPMSRVYYGQNIPEGYTVTNPYGWKPNTDGSGNLAPVSTYEDVKDPIQGKVGLVRTCAKVSANISGDGLPYVNKVEYVNAFKYHSMKQLEAKKTFGDTELQTIELYSNRGDALNKPLVAYVPETLFDTSATATAKPSWDTTKDVGLNGANYLRIEMKSGRVYTIPVLHNGLANSPKAFIAHAKSDEANYDIVRNNHYQYNIILPEDYKQLDVQFKVMPWTLVESEMSYARPAYDLQIIGADDRKYKQILEEVILNDVNYKPTSVTIKFKITAPKGAIWTATITNGRDFILDGEVKGLINEGIVTGVEEWHTMTLTPRYPFEKEPRYTQFYITVEGKEIYLGFDSSGNIINRFIGDGSAEKWRFKQERTILQGLGN